MSASSLAPYIPLTCEEVSTVTSVAHWTNTRVRIIGEVSGRIAADNTSILKSLGEDSAHEVILDLTLAPEKSGILLHPGSWVQVKLKEGKTKIPLLRDSTLSLIKWLNRVLFFRC